MATDLSSAKLKSGMAVHHLRASQLFAQCVREIEETNSAPTEAIRSQHRAYVIGTLFTAAGFLEASINELYVSAADGAPWSEFGLDNTKAAAMAEVWRNPPPRWALMQKFRTALQRCQLPDYNVNTSPFDAAQDLVVLRNAITHYKPEWDDDLDKHANLEERLIGKFEESRFSIPAQVFFPHRCLGAGCATWAVSAATAFVLDFRGRMGLKETFPIDQVIIRPTGGQ